MEIFHNKIRAKIGINLIEAGILYVHLRKLFDSVVLRFVILNKHVDELGVLVHSSSIFADYIYCKLIKF